MIFEYIAVSFLCLGFFALMFILPIKYISLLLGVILPIDLIGSINPIVFDAARYGLAIALIIRLQKTPLINSKMSQLVLFILLTLAVIYSIKVIMFGSLNDAYSSLVSIVSALVAYGLAIRSQHVSTILVGFLIGCAANGIDILLQYFDYPYLGSPSLYGSRYGGLTHASTQIAPYLAVALIILIAPSIWKESTGSHRSTSQVIRIIAIAIIGFALVVSGGRGGLVGLLVSLCLLLLVSTRKRPLMAISASVALVLLFIKSFDFIKGLLRIEADLDFTSGRTELNGQAWDAFTRGGIFGVAPDELMHLRPHTPVLYFALESGVFGLLLSSLILSIILYLCVNLSSSKFLIVYRMIATLILITSFLEPTGFFVGFTKVFILMIVLVQWDISRTGKISNSYSRTIMNPLPTIRTK